MLVIHGKSKIPESTAVALGMFDGVHQGHKAIIEQAVNYAQNHGLKSAVVTLSNHPKSLTRGEAPKLITDLDSRLKIFEELGVDIVLVIEFTMDIMNMEPEDYLQKYLADVLNAKFISIGYDHHFGRERKGSPQLLKAWCEEQNIELAVLEAFHINGELVSSSTIRAYVAEGLIDPTNKLLGHSFTLKGKVIEGEKRGHQIGFPTANLDIDPRVQVLATGVYKARARILDIQKKDSDLGYEFSCALQAEYQAVVNIGYKPTFHKNNNISLTVEAHLLNFDGDLYGKNLELSFLEKIRDEQQFDSVEALTQQINKDIEVLKNTN